jgi:hypothetical protein
MEGVNEQNTNEYTPPKFAVKPYPGDTGYDMVRAGYTRSKYSSIDLEEAKHKERNAGTTDPAPDPAFEAETSAYPAPEFVIKPYPGDTGFPLVKKELERSQKGLQKNEKPYGRKKGKGKRVKTFEEFNTGSAEALFEAQEYYFTDQLKSDRVSVQNAPGAEGATATIKWSLSLLTNSSGVESFAVDVKELSVSWGADEDLGMPGSAKVDPRKVETLLKGSLFNLYVEEVTYDNENGTAEVRLGREQED